MIEWIRRKKGFNPNDALFNFEAGAADIQYGSSNVDKVVYQKLLNYYGLLLI